MKGKTFWDDIEEFNEARLRADDEDVIEIVKYAINEGIL